MDGLAIHNVVGQRQQNLVVRSRIEIEGLKHRASAGGEIVFHQLHLHNPVGAPRHSHFDDIVSGLRRAAVSQPDAIFVAIPRRQGEIEHAADGEARIVLQALRRIRGIDVGVEGCIFTEEGVAWGRSRCERGVTSVH
jgi:hypothetical protein